MPTRNTSSTLFWLLLGIMAFPHPFLPALSWQPAVVVIRGWLIPALETLELAPAPRPSLARQRRLATNLVDVDEPM